MNNSGLNMEIVKDHNRALIIQLICTNNGVTRQDLTEATNLTPMTLTNITSELIKNNLICEIDAKNTGKGRTPKLLYPAPKFTCRSRYFYFQNLYVWNYYRFVLKYYHY